VERGFFGTAVPEIAEKAGVGAGTIYRYFESKEALVNALYRQEKQRFAERTLHDFPRSSIARELFRTMWMRMAKFAIDNPKPFVFMELHHHASYLDAESRALEQRMLELFANIVVAAQARGELKAGQPRLLMGLVMGAFVGVIRTCVELAQPLADADWAFAEQCVWEAIRA
jgi:AcrR family transcriptional regulator